MKSKNACMEELTIQEEIVHFASGFVFWCSVKCELRKQLIYQKKAITIISELHSYWIYLPWKLFTSARQLIVCSGVNESTFLYFASPVKHQIGELQENFL